LIATDHRIHVISIATIILAKLICSARFEKISERELPIEEKNDSKTGSAADNNGTKINNNTIHPIIPHHILGCILNNLCDFLVNILLTTSYGSLVRNNLSKLLTKLTIQSQIDLSP